MTQAIDINSFSQLLKVIAEPKRLEILALLRQGIHCNCEMGEKLNMAPNLISHHLRVLYEAGLIEMERDALDGRWIYYSIQPAAIKQMLNDLQAFFDLSLAGERRPNCGPGSKKSLSKEIMDIQIAGKIGHEEK